VTVGTGKERELGSAAVSLAYDLSQRLSVALEDGDERVASLMRREFDPFSASARLPDAPDVVLRSLSREPPTFRELQNPARDGLVTASDGERMWVLAGGRACAIPDPFGEGVAAFEYERGFPLRRMFRSLVRPALQLVLPRRAAVAAHAATVELDGRAVMVAGWSESGKTETALALAERGASFLSDKWTILGEDGEASAFPVNVGIRRWALPYLPRLASGLSRASRRRLAAAGATATLSAPIRRRADRSGVAGVAGRAAERAVALADRAALTPAELRAAYGQQDDPARRVPVGAVVLLTTVPDGPPTAEPADPGWGAARLVRTAAYERRDFSAFLERRDYALARGRGEWAEAAIAEERRLLEGVLETTRVLEVRAPFPTDPRPVAAAIAHRL
jgi:hypothetical protein